jgi:alpha-beta hydrolase superfamily lysophospholipase
MPYEYWELRQGGYDRAAFVLGDPFVPFGKSTRFIRTLVNHRFKVYSAGIPISCGESGPAPGLSSLASHIAEFSTFIRDRDSLPLVPIVNSFAALPFLASLGKFGAYRAALLISPVMDWGKEPFPARFFPLGRSLDVEIAKDTLTDCGPGFRDVEEFVPDVLHFAKSLVRSLRRDPGLAARAASGLSFPVAVFYGTKDALADPAAIESLKANSRYACNVFSYAGMRHLAAFEKKWEELEGDLAAWIDVH